MFAIGPAKTSVVAMVTLVILAGLRLMAVWTARESRGVREEVQGSGLGEQST